MLQSPEAAAPLVLPLSSRLLTSSIFIPENSPLVRCTFTLPSSATPSFFPCREDSKQRVWAVNKFPPPTYTATHTHTHSGCIWAKRAFWNHKRLSYHMIAFCMSHTWITGHRRLPLTPRGSRPETGAHVTNCRKTKTVHGWEWNMNMSDNKAAWQLNTAEV